MDEKQAPPAAPQAQAPATPPPATPPSQPASSNAQAPQKKGMLKPLLIVFAVLLVVLAGVLYWFVFRSAPAPQSTETSMQEAPKLFLSLTHPTGEETAVNGELLVSGKTIPHATVIIFSDSDDASVESDDQGMFEGTVVMGSGDSVVKVTAYDASGNEESQTLSVAPES